MKLYDAIQRMPAGMLLVPTIVGTVIHTFCPQLLQLGNPTQMLFTQEGMQCCVGMMLFFTGTQFSLSGLRSAARVAVPFLVFKYLLAYGLAGAFLLLFGQDGVMGVSFLAFAVAITSCNSVLFLATVSPCDEAERAVFGIMTLLSMPVFPLLLLGGAAGGGVDWTSLASVCVPLALGLVLGNVDERFRDMFKNGTACIMPFFGFQFGSLIDLGSFAGQIPQGVFLTLVFYLLSAVPLYAFERCALGRSGRMGVASCSVAGIAVSFPTMAAAVAPLFEAYADAALSQLALAMFATTFLTPALAHAVARRARRRPGAGRAASGDE